MPESLNMVVDARDSRHHDRRQHSVRLDPVAHSSQKFFYFVEYRILISDERKVIVSGKLDKLRIRNPLRYKPSFFNFQTLILRAMDDERRHAYRRQYVSH